jgi:hypothetical protein
MCCLHSNSNLNSSKGRQYDLWPFVASGEAPLIAYGVGSTSVIDSSRT